MISNNLSSAFLPKSVKHCISYVLNFVLWQLKKRNKGNGSRSR